MSAKIICPDCGRILGDADRSIDGLRINCKNCKKPMKIDLVIAQTGDYMEERSKI